jgi:hypothetical protein
MPKWKVSVVLLAIGTVGLAQTASDLDAPAVQRVAQRVMCSCGCKLNMTCLMPPGLCSVCQKGKAKIYAMQAQGKPDAAILDEFVKDGGLESLIASAGAMGVAVPCGAFLLGLGLVIWKIRRYTGTQSIDAPEPDTAIAKLTEQYLAGTE